jgi:general secretion pathway protein A
MYESFFGLSEKPFNLTPDPRYFYLSESHREALSALIYGVQERAGLITLTGPVGLGKTMILASFLDQTREHAETACFSGAVSQDRIRFLKDLCSLLGISSEEDSRFGLSQAVKDFAIRKKGGGRSVVVLVDEAQDLGREELEHFHHLSNLETPDAKLLQIVLAGTEKLDEKLRDPGLEALWQRVAIRCTIKPIEPEETIAYIFHRVGVAGGASRGLFTEDALWRILNFSRGVPRLINLVCNQAMISAFSSGRYPVDDSAVMEALNEIEGGCAVSGADEVVQREKIGGLIEAAARSKEEGAPVSLGDQPWGDHGAVVGRQEGEGMARVRGRWRNLFSRILPGRRFSLGFVAVFLFAAAGMLMTMGLLRARDGGVERVRVSLSRESGEGWAKDPSEKPEPGYETPRGGPERSVRENGVDEMHTGLLPLRWPEGDESLTGPYRPVDRSEEAAEQRIAATEQASAKAGVRKTIREKDVARIALEQYGRLDTGILRMLREQNPQIRDWNRLGRTVEIVLPEMPRASEGMADFYTIQVGAFKEGGRASARASELEKKGAQNLFLVGGEGDNRLTTVCVGVFETGRQSSGNLDRVKAWGFDDAFPTRIRGKRLEEILQP